MGHCGSDTAVAKHRLAFADFWNDKFYFLGLILFVFRVVTLNRRGYGCFLPLLSGFRNLLSGNAWAYGQRCFQNNESLREPCAKHLAPMLIFS